MAGVGETLVLTSGREREREGEREKEIVRDRENGGGKVTKKRDSVSTTSLVF